jgi:hypothetical protein
VDNRWLPLKPGSQFVYVGKVSEGQRRLSHRVVFTVTDLTKEIKGVRSRVMHDVDVNNGRMVEEELSFFAQDDAGTVWNTGEYPEEHDASGAFTGAPKTWIAGLGFAEAGVHAFRNPQVGTPPYVQGDAPLVSFLDCGEIYQKDQSVTVPHASYDRVLVVREWAPLDRAGGFQLKYHAPGVGIVKVGAINDPEGETLVLTRYAHLGQAARDRLNRAALALDAHGHSAGVSWLYRTSSRVHRG